MQAPAAGTRRAVATSGSTRASARWGLTVRSILLTPRSGFEAAFKLEERRTRTGRRGAGGVVPVILGAVGGASLMLLWIKLGGLLGLRDAPRSDFRWGYLAAALVVGALLGLAGFASWGLIGRRVTDAMMSETRAGDLRFVWGMSALPQVAVFLFLLPLDLLITGPEAFTSTRPTDSVATAWAAFSIAVGVSLAAWSLYLFVRGTQAASDLGAWKTVGTLAAAGGILLVLYGLPVILPELIA